MSLVARFVVPLRLAPTLNAYARMHFSVRMQIKHECYMRMLAQHGRRSEPLAGRPLLLVQRHSVKEPDQDAGWCKVPIDCLKADKQGLGFIRDDSPDAVDVRAMWAKGKRGAGEVVIEVWEDEDLLGGAGRSG